MNGAAWLRILLVFFFAPDWSEGGIEDDINNVTNCLPRDYMFKVRRRITEPVYCRVEEALQKYVENAAEKFACLGQINSLLNSIHNCKPENDTCVKKCNGSSNDEHMENMNFVNLTEFRCLVLRAFKKMKELGCDLDLNGEDACFDRTETWYQCSTISTITTTPATHTNSATTRPTLSTSQETMSTTQPKTSTTQTTTPQAETSTANISETTLNATSPKVSRLTGSWESGQWSVVITLLVSLTVNVVFIYRWARNRKLSMNSESIQVIVFGPTGYDCEQRKVQKRDSQTESEGLIGQGLQIQNYGNIDE